MYTDTSMKSPTKEVTFMIEASVFENEYSLNVTNANETSLTNLRKLKLSKNYNKSKNIKITTMH